MDLSSSSFGNGQEIPQRCGKKLENLSPHLSWEGAPKATKSFALSLADKHPVARGYVHWLVADIDPAVTSLREGASGSQMPARAREVKPYAGPFPPSGTHEYEFTLYALDAGTLDLPAKATLEAFAEAVRSHVLEATTLVGTFTKIRSS